MKQNILITGGTGFIGQHLLFEVLPDYLSGANQGHIYLLIRNKSDRNALNYVKNLLNNPWMPSHLQGVPVKQMLEHIVILDGDLRDKNLNEQWNRHICRDTPLQVYHSGGSVNLFSHQTAEQEIAEHNLQGTKNVLQSLHGHRFKFMFISTAFSCGIRSGTMTDHFADLPPVDVFRNPYEAAKNRIEQWLLEYGEEHHVSIQIARPSVVVGRLQDSPLYFTSKFDVIYGWGKFIWAMKRRNADGPIRIAVNVNSALNLIPVDYVAKACVRLSQSDLRELNIVHSRSVPHLLYLYEIVKQIDYSGCEWVGEVPGNLKPIEKMYYRSAGNAFTPYVIYPHNEYDTSALRDLMQDIPEPDVEQALPKLIEFAVRCEFDESRI